MHLGSLALVVTAVSWLGIIVLLRHTARLQIHAERRLAELDNRDEMVTAYLTVLKDEHHAAAVAISPRDTPPRAANKRRASIAHRDPGTAPQLGNAPQPCGS
jgi:hypothetical protein